MSQLHIKTQSIIFFAILLFGTLSSTSLQADVGVGLSNIFSLDTRENLPPDGPWQILTNKGDSYSEDLLVDNQGKIWAFYLRNSGKSQPIYLKILNPDGYVYKPEEQIATSSGLISGKLQTIRAVLNVETGDVWVTFQGDADGVGKGYFMIFDGDGTVKVDQTVLPGEGGIYFPKMACDQNGKMWFVWQTDSTYSGFSIPEYARYTMNGSLDYGPASVRNIGNTSNTEIVVDSNNRIWFIYERGATTLFTRILNNDNTEFQGEIQRVTVDLQYPFNPQRMALAAPAANRVLVLAKHINPEQQDILIFDLDGDNVGDINNVGNVNFFINEKGNLEVVQDDGAAYQKGEFDPYYGDTLSEPKWSPLFTNIHSFVPNGVAYNATYEKVKAYLVQTDADITKFYVQPIIKAPKLYVTPATIDFGEVRLNEPSTEPFLVENSGTALLTVTNITSNNNQFTVDISDFELEPGRRQRVNLTFRPQALATVQGVITISSNDPANPDFQMPVSGTGRDILDQKIAVTQDTLRFGEVPVSGSKSLTLGIINEGEKVLNIDSLVFVNPQFSTKTDTMEIKPGVTRNISVVFQPTGVDEVRGALEIYNDDPMSWRKDVQLIGTGRTPFPQAIALSADSLDFGGIEIDHEGAQVLTIFNEGEQALQITNIQSDNPVFSVTQTSYSVGGGDSREISVTFHPTEIRTYSGNLTITSDDPEQTSSVVKLRGEGRKVNRPQIAVSADSLNFGGVQVGRQRTKSLKIENLGDLALEITGLAISPSQFQTETADFTLAPNSYRWLEIHYYPDAQENHQGELVISSNDPDQPTIRVNLFGSGTAVNPPQLTVNPKELVFDTTGVQNSVSEWIYLTNSGSETLVISEISTNNSQFDVTASTMNLVGGQTAYLPVKFTPTSVGAVEGKLILRSNDAANETMEIRLFGVGREQRDQEIYVYPLELNFGTIAVGNTTTQNLLVKNLGEKNLTIQEIDSQDSQFACSVSNVVLTPNESRYLPVTYTPSSAGSITSELTILSNDPQNATVSVTVSGAGRSLTLQKIYWSPEQISFSTTPIGQVSQKTLWIYNQGEQLLVVNSIRVSDNQFSVSESSFNVEPGKYQQLTVSYAPLRTGAASGVITISNNDVTNSNAEIRVRGDARELLPPVVAADKSEIYFGSVAVGDMSSRNLTIENEGEKALQISQIFAEDEQFSISATAFSLAPGASRLLIITFRPDQLDSVNTRMGIVSNSSGTDTSWVNLTGRGRTALPQAIRISADTLDFGTVAQNRYKILELGVQNVGEAVLNVSSISTSDDRFSVSDNNFILQPGQLRMVPVIFEPTRVGEYAEEMTILSDDANNPSKTVNLIAEGRKLIPQSLSLVPESVNFPAVGIGLRAEQIVKMQNPGERTLRIDAITSDNSHFAINLDDINVLPDSSEELLIHFTPTDTGTFQGTITFESDAPGQETVELPLVGSGRNRSQQQLTLSTDTLRFENVGVGRTASKYFRIQNTGENGLLVYNIVPENHQLHVDTTSFAINPLSERAIRVDFSPVLVGSSNSSIVISSNDPNQPQDTLHVYGSSRAFMPQKIVLDRYALSFDTTATNRTTTKIVNVSNVGDSRLTISNITSSNTQFIPAETKFTVESGNSHALEIAFAPKMAGVAESALMIYSDDPQNPGVTVNLSGFGEILSEQRIAISPERIDFGQVPISDSASQKIWVINMGEQPLLVDSVGIDDSHFILAQTFFNISPSASQESWVTFKPTAFDTLKAQMRFKSNDPVNPYVDVPLAGSGRQLKPPQILATPETLDFKEVGWGFTTQKPLYIQNTGEQTLVVENVITSDTSLFKVNGTNFTVGAERTQILYVTFAPKVSGLDSSAVTFDEKLTIINNVSEQEIQLRGVGRPLAAPTIFVEPEALDFDTVAVGRSASRNITIFNNGEQDLVVTDIDLADTEKKNQFEVDKKVFTVPSGANQVVKVTYAPTQIDTINSKLVIASNDPVTPSMVIPVAAHSINYTGPAITVRPAALAFGQLLRGSKRIKSFFVINDGPELLQVSSIRSTAATHFSASIDKFSVASGDSQRVDVSFTPTDAVYYSANMIIYSNDKYQQNYSLPLTGQGANDESGTPIFTQLNWVQGASPFDSTTQNQNNNAWFLRDFDIYETPTSATLSLAYHEGIKVYINGALVYDGAGDTETFRYWNREIDPLPYLQFGRNRIAVELFTSDYNISFDAEMAINGNLVILRGLNNQGNPLSEWWNHFTTPPSAMTGVERKWFSNEYGFTGLDSLVGYWPFNEDRGTIIHDLSPQGRRAILNNITWVDGLGAQVMQFNGTNSFVKLEANINSLPLATQMWVRPTGTPQKTQILISNMGEAGNAQGLFLTNDSYLGIYVFNQQLTSTYVLEPDKWYYISLRIFSTRVILYVNGEVVYTQENMQMEDPSGYGYCTLGTSPVIPTNLQDQIEPFNGAISNVEIYNISTVENVVPSVMQAIPVSTPRAIAGATLNLDFNIEPLIGTVGTGYLKYRMGGARTEYQADLTSTDTLVTASIPANHVTIRGLEYRMVINTNLGKVYFPSSTDTTLTNWSIVRTSGETASMESQTEIYQMVSVPYELGSKTISSVLSDDFGTYDPYNWRVFKWFSTTNDSGFYLEADDERWSDVDQNFSRGEAFWLVTYDTKTFDADSGYSAENRQPYELTLQQGWNQIASPFPFAVSWDAVDKSASISDLYYYNPEYRGYEMNHSLMLPWRGYFVNNQLPYPISVSIPAAEFTVEDDDEPVFPKASFAQKFLTRTEQAELVLNISGECGKYHDPDNILAVTQESRHEWDTFDAFEAPPIGNYISIWVNNTNWQNSPGAYCVDVRPTGEAGYVWHVECQGQVSRFDEKMTLTFDRIIEPESGMELYLFDLYDEVARNLRETESYEFEIVPGKAFQRRFKIVLGDENFVRENSDGISLEPLSFALMQNYPNPFNPMTLIRFSLPQKSETRLAIYNVLGQEVVVLVNEVLRAARHEVIWNATDSRGIPVASGVYFIKLKSNEQTQVRKMMLIR